jgi:hypothetical protein
MTRQRTKFERTLFESRKPETGNEDSNSHKKYLSSKVEQQVQQHTSTNQPKRRRKERNKLQESYNDNDTDS